MDEQFGAAILRDARANGYHAACPAEKSGQEAAEVDGFIGFPVGRTAFWKPLMNYRAKKITREAAVTEMARRYEEFVGIFEKARSARTSHEQHRQTSNQFNRKMEGE